MNPGGGEQDCRPPHKTHGVAPLLFARDFVKGSLHSHTAFRLKHRMEALKRKRERPTSHTRVSPLRAHLVGRASPAFDDWLIALARDICAGLGCVATFAEAARHDVEALRRKALAADPDNAPRAAAIALRTEELLSKIQDAEAGKAAGLERELVSVDALLDAVQRERSSVHRWRLPRCPTMSSASNMRRLSRDWMHSRLEPAPPREGASKAQTFESCHSLTYPRRLIRNLRMSSRCDRPVLPTLCLMGVARSQSNQARRSRSCCVCKRTLQLACL